MKIYEVEEPTGYTRYNELDILLIYWGWWSREVFKERPDNTFNIIPDICIEDWVMVNWADEVGEI